MVTEFEVEYVFSRSSMALDGPEINQSNCEFVLSNTIIRLTKNTHFKRHCWYLSNFCQNYFLKWAK